MRSDTARDETHLQDFPPGLIESRTPGSSKRRAARMRQPQRLVPVECLLARTLERLSRVNVPVNNAAAGVR